MRRLEFDAAAPRAVPLVVRTSHNGGRHLHAIDAARPPTGEPRSQFSLLEATRTNRLADSGAMARRHGRSPSVAEEIASLLLGRECESRQRPDLGSGHSPLGTTRGSAGRDCRILGMRKYAGSLFRSRRLSNPSAVRQRGVSLLFHDRGPCAIPTAGLGLRSVSGVDGVEVPGRFSSCPGRRTMSAV